MPPLFMEEDIMLEIKLGNTELKIKFGYEVVARTGILQKLVELGNKENGNLGEMDKIMNILPELILVGVQKTNKDRFGYDYRTGAGKDKKLDIVYDLLDEYFEQDDADFMELFNQIQDELVEKGFLSKMFREEQKEEQKDKKEKAES